MNLNKSKDFRIWKILKQQGRSAKWLADTTGMSTWHVYHVKLGTRAATDDFQIRCEAVLQVPRDLLFSVSEGSVA